MPFSDVGEDEAAGDRITRIALSLATLPLKVPVSDAKVLTGRQRPLREIALLFAEIESAEGHKGLGFSYSKRAGGPALYAHAKEIAPELLGEDPNDIARLWTRLVWAGASVGRGGLATQAIAAMDIALWDMKARRAGLPLAKLLGAHREAVRCYNTSGGFLNASIGEILANVDEALAAGIGGIKIKVGHPDAASDLKRVEKVRDHIGGAAALMVDANQQWDRMRALRIGRSLEGFGLTWIEEPLDAYDAEGHAQLAGALDTPIASGEMLTSAAEHWELIRRGAVDFIQPDAARVGGITQFLKIMAMGEQAQLPMAPHFAMEIHVHLAAAYPHETWVEHFDWLAPLFEEQLETREGHMIVPARPGLGLSLSDFARRCAVAEQSVGEVA
ncbi:MAG: L-talarate/galactarate dehydratase [Sphingomonadales bacterium]|jgi:L-alanine-DL-glutamate epimerase-like enolase superfamily enzyme|nr:L-talarate/galactarate dehydratase [Sphingomonadales bacterium]